MSTRPTRWRPIATAPKDAQILLLYRGHDQLPFVCQGRWVEWPHENVYLHVLRNSDQQIEDADTEGRWEVCYVATCGFASETSHWKPNSFRV